LTAWVYGREGEVKVEWIMDFKVIDILMVLGDISWEADYGSERSFFRFFSFSYYSNSL
jgi:predicted phosphohydrolase